MKRVHNLLLCLSLCIFTASCAASKTVNIQPDKNGNTGVTSVNELVLDKIKRMKEKQAAETRDRQPPDKENSINAVQIFQEPPKSENNNGPVKFEYWQGQQEEANIRYYLNDCSMLFLPMNRKEYDSTVPIRIFILPDALWTDFKIMPPVVYSVKTRIKPFVFYTAYSGMFKGIRKDCWVVNRDAGTQDVKIAESSDTVKKKPGLKQEQAGRKPAAKTKVRKSSNGAAQDKKKPKKTVIPDEIGAGAEEKSRLKLHEVKSGETLPSIAKKYYGSRDGWMKIYKANEDKIDKGLVNPGQVIVIPE